MYKLKEIEGSCARVSFRLGIQLVQPAQTKASKCLPYHFKAGDGLRLSLLSSDSHRDQVWGTNLSTTKLHQEQS